MTAQLRDAPSADGHASPAWKTVSVGRLVGFLVALALRLGAILRRHRRSCILAAGAALCLVSQVMLLCTAFYLVDLCISLMELWAELARKHLEITLS